MHERVRLKNFSVESPRGSKTIRVLSFSAFTDKSTFFIDKFSSKISLCNVPFSLRTEQKKSAKFSRSKKKKKNQAKKTTEGSSQNLSNAQRSAPSALVRSSSSSRARASMEIRRVTRETTSRSKVGETGAGRRRRAHVRKCAHSRRGVGRGRRTRRTRRRRKKGGVPAAPVAREPPRRRRKERSPRTRRSRASASAVATERSDKKKFVRRIAVRNAHVALQVYARNIS